MAAPPRPQTPPLRAGDGIPLYVKLASLFRDKIARGEWPVGTQIATLPELQAQYGVARATLQQAIRLLSQDGLVSSTRGRGTFVTARGTPDTPAPVYDMLGLGEDFRIELLSHDLRDDCPGVAQPLPANEAPFVHVRKRHHYRGKPYSIVDLFLPKSIFDRLPAQQDETFLYAQLIRDHTDLTQLNGEQTISIKLADQDLALALDVPFAAPLARIDSTLRADGGRHIMAHLAYIRGDMFLARRSLSDILHTDPAEWRPLAPGKTD